MELPNEIRDQREQEWYWMNNEFIDQYGEIVGTHAVGVYSVLCRHANNDTQRCFPSMETIGRKAGIKSRKTVSKAIEILESYRIIEVEKAQGADGKRLNNIYHLMKPKHWKGARVAAPAAAEVPVEEVAAAPVAEKKVVDEIVLPEWLDKEAWAEWVAFRKEIKKKFTPLMIKQQLKMLEQHKAAHTEIIRTSIRNGWQGLFAPKKSGFNNTAANKVPAAAGKYAGL